MRRDDRTATPSLTPAGSSSRVPRMAMKARAALIAANELLRYRIVDDVYEEWLDRVTELHYTAPRPARVTKLRGRPSRLLRKKATWLKGAWPLGGT